MEQRGKSHREGCLSHRPQSRCLLNPILRSCQTPKETHERWFENPTGLIKVHRAEDLMPQKQQQRREPRFNNTHSQLCCGNSFTWTGYVRTQKWQWPHLHEVCSGWHVTRHVPREHRVKYGPGRVVTGWSVVHKKIKISQSLMWRFLNGLVNKLYLDLFLSSDTDCNHLYLLLLSTFRLFVDIISLIFSGNSETVEQLSSKKT